ncbi:DUF7475 family protein [Natronosalvus halobius]|uniref:DUF7475 family protein n=1 Tax=Natronosalvus halobius TaxID=2953746 RepID=UPI00209DAD42|nr:hypothetical protein [Natronosalvus halobius]USZ72124.1 hypothetical protein NGM15_02080 [Natronosalvus halobius]
MQFGVRPETDTLNWVLLALGLLLAGIHLYLGLVAPFTPDELITEFVVIGLLFLGGPLLYATPYWRPVLYLVGALFALYLGILWVLEGMERFPIGILTGIVASAFIALAIYLFLRDDVFAAAAGE